MTNYIDMLTEKQKDSLPENIIKMWVYSYQKAQDERDPVLSEISDYFGSLLNYQAKLILDSQSLESESDKLMKELDEYDIDIFGAEDNFEFSDD